MWWTDPVWLVALIIIIPVLFSGNKISLNKLTQFLQGKFFRTGKRQPLADKHPGTHSINKRLRQLTWIRSAALACVIFGLAGTTAILPVKNRRIVALIDVSDSIGNSETEKSRAALLDQINKLSSADRIAVMTFAGGTNIIAPMAKPGDAYSSLKSAVLTAPMPGDTDIQKAISSSKEILSQTTGRRSILLFSDGRASMTEIDAGSLKSLNTSVNTIPVGKRGEGIVSWELKIPDSIHTGEKALLEWNIFSPADLKINYSVKMDDKKILQEYYDVNAGNNIIPVDVSSDSPGDHRIDIDVSINNNIIRYGSISGLLRVSGKDSILLINGKVYNSGLGAALRIQGLNVAETGSSAISESLNGSAAVILDNIPASSITKDQQKSLQNYTAAGGGLLVIGGDSSLGRGEYYESILEDILPVNTDTRQRIFYNRTEVVYAIDHSGSMTIKRGRITKYEAALNGVAASVNEMDPRDKIGIVTFDEQAEWKLPLISAGRKKEIYKALSDIPLGGGTDMSKAFDEVISRFSILEPVSRHLIVITDGLTIDKDFKSLCHRLVKNGFTISTIGIGNEINESLLKDIADWGNGQFYRVELDAVPEVVHKESMRITRDLIQEGGFKPKVRIYADWLADSDTSFPMIKGYLLTRPKNLAVVNLEVGEHDPLFAWWRYGNGNALSLQAIPGPDGFLHGQALLPITVSSAR